MTQRSKKLRRFYTAWITLTMLTGVAAFAIIFVLSGTIGAASADSEVVAENLDSNTVADSGSNAAVNQEATTTVVPLISAPADQPAQPEQPAEPTLPPTPVPTINAPELQGELPDYPDFTLGAHVAGRLTGEESEEMWNALGVAKMDWIKLQVRYDRGANPDDYGWQIQLANSQGYGVLLGVVGHREDLYQPGYMDEFAAYVGHLALIGANGIEVWNEANIDREWPNGRIGGAAYAELLQKAYTAIKANNPDTKVISAGPAPTGAAGPGQTACSQNAAICNDDVWYKELAAAGAANFMDCIGAHYNEGVVSPTWTEGDTTRNQYPTMYLQSNTDRAAAPFRQAGSDLPVCYTELGYVTPEGYGELGPNFWWGTNVTLQQQATWLATAALINAQSGDVEMMIIWNLDFHGYDPQDPKSAYAMVREDGACPACDSFGLLRPNR